MSTNAEAKGKGAKKAVPEAISPKEIRLVNKKGLERVYANYARITHSNMDFTLTFADVPVPAEMEATQQRFEESGVIKAPIVCRLVLPIRFIPALIKALTDDLSKFTSMREREAAERLKEKRT